MLQVTFVNWKLSITVAILSSLGQEPDPMLDLGHTAVHSMAGALTAIADNSNLGESKFI